MSGGTDALTNIKASEVTPALEALTTIIAVLIEDMGLDEIEVSELEFTKHATDSVMFRQAWNRSAITITHVRGGQ